MDENIRDLDKLAQDVIDDKELLHEVFYKMRKEVNERLKVQGMYMHMKEVGVKQGVKQGEKQGEKKSKIEIAKRMLEMGMSIEQIEKVTDLTREEIEKLKKEI